MNVEKGFHSLTKNMSKN